MKYWVLSLISGPEFSIRTWTILLGINLNGSRKEALELRIVEVQWIAQDAAAVNASAAGKVLTIIATHHNAEVFGPLNCTLNYRGAIGFLLFFGSLGLCLGQARLIVLPDSSCISHSSSAVRRQRSCPLRKKYSNVQIYESFVCLRLAALLSDRGLWQACQGSEQCRWFAGAVVQRLWRLWLSGGGGALRSTAKGSREFEIAARWFSDWAACLWWCLLDGSSGRGVSEYGV